MMRSKKGLASWLLVVIILAVALAVGGVVYLGATQLAVTPTPTAPIEYNGELDDVDVPQEISGTDLQVDKAYSESDDVFNATLNTTYNINGSAGSNVNLAFMFEVSGSNGVENLQIDADYSDSDVTTSEAELRKVYIVEDTEDNNLGIEDAVYSAEVDTDQDQFEFDITGLSEGEYVLNAEIKTISPGTLNAGEELLQVEFDANTDGDVDEGTVYINNGA